VSGFERWNLWITTALVILTGAGLFAVKYLMVPSEPWAVISHPIQPWLLKAHILVSPFMIFAVGTITVRHIWQHYRNGQARGRHTGMTTAMVTIPMILTGYLIQVATSLGWIKALAIAHIAFGTVYALGVSAHQIAIQRQQPRDIRHEPPRPHRSRKRQVGSRTARAAPPIAPR
jgi:hypothetical protein